MLDLKQIAIELNEKGWFFDQSWKEEDQGTTEAVEECGLDLADRRRMLVSWLSSYSTLMGLSNSVRAEIAGQILSFAYERQDRSFLMKRERIVSEFDKLRARISADPSL